MSNQVLPGRDAARDVTQRIGQGEFLTAAPSGEIAVTVDKLQYIFGEGPGVQATFQDDLLSSTNIRTDPRWPRGAAHLWKAIDSRLQSQPDSPLVHHEKDLR